MSSIAQPVARSVSRSVLAGQRMNLWYLIRSMFSQGEQGFAYDINDLSTLFQDAAGTIPVTGAGQPVGLVLDKSKGLVLGGELVANGNFESGLIGAKNDSGLSVSTWVLNTISPISGTQDGKLTITTAATARPSLLFPTLAKKVGEIYEISFDYKLLSGTAIIYGVYNGVNITVYNRILTGSGKATFRYLCTGATTEDYIYFGASLCSVQLDNISVKQVLGNHAYQTTSSMRPLLQRNATTGAYYLVFDGTDDFLVTNSIDFTATDKVSLFSGLVNLNTASDAMFLELSSNLSSYTGSFYITVPETSQVFGGVPRILSISRGSNIALHAQAAYTSQVAPQSRHVLSAKHDISASMSTIRDNGAAGVSGVGDKGAGNFGNYPLYIGRRGGASLPFNGHLYSLVGVGRLSTDAETTSLEKAIAKNVGVTL